MSKVEKYQLHRPVDTSDPGFTIPGRKLRWVSGKVTELAPGRPWVVMRKSDLNPDLIKHLEGINPDVFAQGETVRRGDLTLAYAKEEAANVFLAEKRQAAIEQEQAVKRSTKTQNKKGETVLSVEVDEEHDATQEIINKFKEGND